MDRADVLIVGGGIAGLSTAYWLARNAGCRIRLLEREPTLGRHSSGKSAAILRSLGTDPVLDAMTRAGGGFLRRPPEDFGAGALLDASGLVLVASGERAHTLEQALQDRPETAGTALSAHALERAAPHLSARGATRAELALHFPLDGRIDVPGLLDGLARGARAAGCEISTGAVVTELVRRADRVCGVRLADGRVLEAATVVLAAGGWAGELGRRAGSEVTLFPTRRHLLVSAEDRRIDPRWPVVWVEHEDFYARPEEGGMLLCACDEDAIDPDDCRIERSIPERILARAASILSPLAPFRSARSWCGIRTLSADGRFALGPDPDLAGLFWVAGLAGHGMAAGAEVGRLAAALLAGQPVDPALARAFDPARLAQHGSRTR